MPSTKPVYQKLGLKPSHQAVHLHVPGDVRKALGNLPSGCRVGEDLDTGTDFVLGFYEAAKVLTTDLPRIRKALQPSGMAWVCWKKGNVTDLSRDSIAAAAEKAGLEGVASCSIDDSWSALKLMYPKDQRA